MGGSGCLKVYGFCGVGNLTFLHMDGSTSFCGEALFTVVA